MTKTLISSVWNKILRIWERLFELIQIEAQCSKNYLIFFLSQGAGAFGKATTKIGKICILYIYKEYLPCLKSNASGRFFGKTY